MPEHCYIGLDCSTTSATAIAWSLDGQILARASHPIPINTPAPGFAEQQAETWWSASARALNDCIGFLPSSHKPAGIGVTTQRETFAILNSYLRPVRPAILWYDSRASNELQQLTLEIGHETYHRVTGKQLDITSPLVKMTWLARNEPEYWGNAAFFVDVAAFLAAKLTGLLSTAVCGIDTCGLLDMKTSSWASDLLAHVPGSDALQFPELQPPCSITGGVTADAAAQCGLPEGIPVTIAGGDGHCFSVGASAACGSQHVSLTLGTSAVVGVPLAKEQLSDAFRTLISCFPGQYLGESVIQCGSATIRWFDDAFWGKNGRTSPHEWDRECAAIPPGCNGLLVLPHWRGVRVPYNDPLARGVVLGWNDRQTPASFRRAIMEGIALEVDSLLTRIGREMSQNMDTVVVAGGGGKCDLWCQILADVLKRDVCRPQCIELTSLGAALCARVACEKELTLHKAAEEIALPAEHFRPNSDTAVVYNKLRNIYSGLYEATCNASHILAEL